MDISALAPAAFLIASFAAGLSGLLVHAQIPRDVAPRTPKPGADDNLLHRRIGTALFGLSLAMFVAAAATWLGQNQPRLAYGLSGHFDKLLLVLIAAVASVAGRKRRKRTQAQQGNEHR